MWGSEKLWGGCGGGMWGSGVGYGVVTGWDVGQ